MSPRLLTRFLIERDIKTWSEKALAKDCAYSPYCWEKACECGGAKKHLCTFYHCKNTPSNRLQPIADQMENAKKAEKRKKQARRKSAAKACNK